MIVELPCKQANTCGFAVEQQTRGSVPFGPAKAATNPARRRHVNRRRALRRSSTAFPSLRTLHTGQRILGRSGMLSYLSCSCMLLRLDSGLGAGVTIVVWLGDTWGHRDKRDDQQQRAVTPDLAKTCPPYPCLINQRVVHASEHANSTLHSGPGQNAPECMRYAEDPNILTCSPMARRRPEPRASGTYEAVHGIPYFGSLS